MRNLLRPLHKKRAVHIKSVNGYSSLHISMLICLKPENFRTNYDVVLFTTKQVTPITSRMLAHGRICHVPGNINIPYRGRIHRKVPEKW